MFLCCLEVKNLRQRNKYHMPFYYKFKRLTAFALAFFIIIMPWGQVFAAESVSNRGVNISIQTTTPSSTEALPDNENVQPLSEDVPPQQQETSLNSSPAENLTSKPEEQSETPLDNQNLLDSESSEPDPKLDTGFKASQSPKMDEVNGALVTEYPLVVPPGRNGFQPDLKLQYNSQNAKELDSAFGAGWSLNIPTIERLNKNGVNNLYSTTTPYFSSSLSGELAQTSTTTYTARTENGEFLNYTFQNDLWTVKDKKGYTYFFGNSTDSTSTTTASGTPELYSTNLYSDGSIVSYYQLEGDSNDSKGSYNGTDSNMSYGNSYGKFNQGATFNGTNARINLGAIFNGKTSFWIHGWIKVTTVPGINTDMSLWGSSSWSGSGNFITWIRGTGSSQFKFKFDLYGDNGGEIATASNFNGNTWYMVDFYVDSTNKIRKIYVNGIEEASVTGSSSVTLSQTTTYLGFNGGTNNYWNGNMDDVAVFSRIPTSTELSSLYFSTTTATSTVSVSAKLEDLYNSNRTNKWYLDRVMEPNGNEIKYEYYKSGAQVYPSKVLYAGNSTSTPLYTVEFNRETRTDVSTSSRTGFQVVTDKRVKDVTVKMNGSWLKKYDLAYTTGDNDRKNLLSSITESGIDENNSTTTLPATSFEYQVSEGGWTTTAINYPLDLHYAIMSDFNGDGYSDILYAARDQYGSSTRIAYVNDGSGNFSTSTPYQPPLDFFVDSGDCQSIYCDMGARIADINGDGLQDIVLANTITKTTYLNTGSGWSASSTWTSPLAFANGTTNVGNLQLADLDDMNGDGLLDIFNIYNNGSSSISEAYLNNGSGFSSSTLWSVVSGISKESRVTIDLNGDTLTDFFQAYTSAGSAEDLNFAALHNGTSTWVNYAPYLSPETFVVGSTDRGVRTFDFNGDGLVDVNRSEYDGSSAVRHGYLNTGNGWLDVGIGWGSPNYFVNSVTPAYSGAKIADIDGNLMADTLNARLVSGNINSETSLNTVKPVDVLKKISFPSGGNVSVNYKAAAQYKDGSNNLLNPNIRNNQQTVYQIITHDGLATSTIDTYTYKGGLTYYASALDKRFAGFSEIDVTDSEGNVNKTYYHQGNSSASTTGEYLDNYYKIGKPYRVEKYDGSGNLFEKTINKWDTATTSNTGFVKLAQTVKYHYDGIETHKDKAEAYTYNNTTGNITQKIEYGEVNGNNDGTFTDVETDDFTTSYTYATSSTSSLMSLLATESTLDHSSTKVKESRYYYDNSALGVVNLGNLTKKEDWKSGGTYVDAEKTYNSYGLVTSEKDFRDKTITYSYDAYNLYPTTVTNPLSHVSQFTYDYSSGKIKQVTDPNGNNFQNVYDGVDRLIEQKQPDPSNTSTLQTALVISYTNIPNSVSVHKTAYLSSTNTVESYVYFDGLGRKKQERIEAEGSNYAVKDYSYNTLGLLQKESLPYFSGGSATTTATTTSQLFINYYYDALLRIATTTNALGTTTAVQSNWNITTTDLNGKTKVLYNDAFGNLKQVDEHNGSSTYTTFYTYNYLVNLTSITDASSNVRNFTYDGLGRRLTAQDLHAPGDATYGTYTYTYDDAGNITTVVDPKSQTVNYTYDDINRQLTEDFTGLAGTEVTNTYDTCSQGQGRLCVASSTDVSIANTYNALGQLTQEVKSISGTNYTTAYTYDRQGNVVTIVNPDNSQVKYIYNTAGLADQIQRKESTDSSFIDVLTNIDYAPTGKETVLTYANGAVTTNTFDANTMYRLARKVTTLPLDMGDSLMSSPEEQQSIIPGEPNIIIEPETGTSTSSTSTLEQIIPEEELVGTSTPETATTSTSTTIEFINEEEIATSSSDTLIPQIEQVENENSATTTESLPEVITNQNIISTIWKALTHAFLSTFRFLAKSFSVKTALAAATELYLTSYYNDANLISYYRMEDTSDSKGSNSLTAVGTPSSVTAKFNNGYSYDGSSYHHTNSNMGINGGAVTISGWIKLNSRPGSGSTWYMASQFNSSSKVEYDFWFTNTSGTYSVSVNRGKSGVSDNPVSTNFDLGTTSYHFLALTYDGTYLRGYLDGESFGSLATSGSGSGGSVNDFVLGAAYNGTSKADAVWDDMAVFSRALSAGEIAELYGITATTRAIQDLSFTYDSNGNITQLAESASTSLERILTYGYDDLNRLTSASTTRATTTPYRYTYTYDSLGNMLSRNENGTTTTYTYATGTAAYLNPHAVATTTAGSSLAYTYDNNGNLLTVRQGTTTPASSYTWDYNNRLTQAVVNGSATSTYQYDPWGQRTKQVVGATTTVYSSNFYNITGSTPTKNIFLPDGTLIAGVVGTGTTTTVSYVHTDHLGGTNVVTDSEGGAVTQLLDFYPYGGKRISEGTDVSQREYIGEFYDENTSLNYLNARYYNSASGKFTSQDPVFWDFDGAWLADPQNQNSYSYARNNPVTLSDPSGRIAPVVAAAWFFLAGILGGTALETYGAIQGDPAVIQTGQHLRQTSEFGGSGLIESTGRVNPITGRKGLTFEVKPGTLEKVNQNNKARIEAEIAGVRTNNLVNSIDSHGSYEKHVLGVNNINGREYGSLFQSKGQWREYVSGVISKPSESFSGATKDLYWDARLGTIVINNKDGGSPTAFRPQEGYGYYQKQVAEQQKKGGGLE